MLIDLGRTADLISIAKNGRDKSKNGSTESIGQSVSSDRVRHGLRWTNPIFNSTLLTNRAGLSPAEIGHFTGQFRESSEK